MLPQRLSEGAYGYSRDSVPKHWFRLTRLWILTLEPERLKNRQATACDESRDGWGSQQTLKLLVVSDVGRRNALLVFQTSKVIAAIFRARVRRAIGGFIPRATEAA